MKVVNQPLRKKDAMQLVTGKPVYVDDVTPRDCLCVKLLRSPHANAIVKFYQQDRRDEKSPAWRHLHLGGRRSGRPPLYTGRSDLSGGQSV